MNVLIKGLFFAYFLGTYFTLFAQPTPLVSDITITHVASIDNPSSSLGYDPITESLIVGNVNGQIWTVALPSGTPVLEYDSLDHGIKHLQGLTVLDSALFLVGNDWMDGTEGIGILRRGVLQPNGTRLWTTVFETEIYPVTNATFGHGFSGITVSPDSNFLFINSGSRTDHGEVQSAEGKFPGVREVPLTSAVFKIPIDALNLLLLNDSAELEPYLFADGIRNTFSLGFNGRGHLLGLENSGDRDDSEEFNFIQEGKHYGFPWRMGGNYTPQQYPGYDPELDPLVNPKSSAAKKGLFYNDSTFPPAPELVFEEPIPNIGPDANYYRSDIDGKLHRGTEENPVFTFTTHRSPLGLCLDSDSVWGGAYTGNGMMFSFTQGGGDSTGHSETAIWGLPIVPLDPAEDLIHLDLNYNPTSNRYSVETTRLAEGFLFAVASVVVGNVIYVVEYGVPENRNIWKITLPQRSSSLNEHASSSPHFFPNPVRDEMHWKIIPEEFIIWSVDGKQVWKGPGEAVMDIGFLSNGSYLIQFKSGENWVTQTLLKE